MMLPIETGLVSITLQLNSKLFKFAFLLLFCCQVAELYLAMVAGAFLRDVGVNERPAHTPFPNCL